MLFAMAYYIYAGSDQPQRAGQEEEQGSDLVEVRPAVNNRWDKVAYALRTAPHGTYVHSTFRNKAGQTNGCP